MRKKLPQSSVKVEGEEIQFANTVQTHTKAELNPVSMKSHQHDSQGQPGGHSLMASYQTSTTTTRGGVKRQLHVL